MTTPEQSSEIAPVENLLNRRREKDLARMVLPTECNCTDWCDPYCGRPECDIDFCQDCGDEYTVPCPRHEGVDHV